MKCIEDVGETQKNENGIVICDEPIKKVKSKMKQDFFNCVPCDLSQGLH